MKKVIEFIPLLANGGAETMMKDYCLGFDREKVDVTVLVMGERMKSANEEVLESFGQKIIYLGEQFYGTGVNLNPFQKLVRFVSRYFEFRKVIMEIRPDVIHSHLHVGLFFRFIPKQILKETKLVYTVHNVFERYFSKSIKNIFKFIEYKEVKRLVHKYSMKLVTLHDDMNKDMREQFASDDVVTIENGIELERFSFSEQGRKRIRQELKIPETAYVIGNVGRFHEQKNHELIVDIFENVSNLREDAYLLLVGKGENTRQATIDKLKSKGLLERTIIIQDRKDIPDIMSGMDVFLFPSRWEGFGNVLIEAQSVGLHCVISDKVPRGTIVSDKVSVVGLNDSVKKWVDALNQNTVMEKPVGDISMYEIANSILRLQDIYTDIA